VDFVIPSNIIENFCFTNFKEAKYSSSGEIHFNSPFVIKDGKLRFYVNPNKSSFFDQKRQVGGSFIAFVSEYFKISKKDAFILLIKEYSNGANKQYVNYKDVIKVNKNIELPKGTTFFIDANTSSRTYKIAKKYLEDRGIKYDNLAYVYDPNGSPEESFHNRVIVPFYENGELVYFIARTFEKDNKLRYKNPKGIDAGNFVFQIDDLKDDVFIFEGVFDALSLHEPQVGTAMLSNKLKTQQIIKILDRAPKRIIFVTENDKNETAIKAGRKNLILNISNFMKYKPASLNIEFYVFNPPLPYKDFNEYATAENIHNINIEKECVKWNAKKIDIEKFNWNSQKNIF